MMLVGVTDTAWTVLHVHEGTVERSRMSNHASMDESEAYLVRLLTTFATIEEVLLDIVTNGEQRTAGSVRC